MNASRRHFLRMAAGLSACHAPQCAPWALSLAGLGALAIDTARAASTDGYRALVCLFMTGGNDAHNWIVPTHSSGHAEYTRVRGDLALPLARLNPLSSTGQGSGRTFGMPKELEPLRVRYEAGQLAVLSNVGPLERPLTRTEYLAGSPDVPLKLFSHNDQQSTWQSLGVEGSESGWGGRMGDLLQSANNRPLLTTVSTAGNAVFLTGRSIQQYQVGMTGPKNIPQLEWEWLYGSRTASALLRQTLLNKGSNPFQSEYARVTQRALDTAKDLRTAIAATSIATLPTTPITLPSGKTLVLATDELAMQLRTVAQMIAAGQKMGLRRRIFLGALGGLDTHSSQLQAHSLLTSRVAHSVDWFVETLQQAGLFDRTVLFTASDFGRTLTSNGDGSDHGWGSHHLILGGGIRGRAIYGNFPVTALGTATDIGNGRLLPTVSVTEYAATLGRWLGLSTSELATALPNLSSFASSDLGFLR